MAPSKTSEFGESYIKILKERGEKSKIYRKHQMIGLELAEILADQGNKSLYIKLAREKNPDELLRIAKDVASRPNVKNKGAYFMRLIHLK